MQCMKHYVRPNNKEEVSVKLSTGSVCTREGGDDKKKRKVVMVEGG